MAQFLNVDIFTVKREKQVWLKKFQIFFRENIYILFWQCELLTGGALKQTSMLNNISAAPVVKRERFVMVLSAAKPNQQQKNNSFRAN